MVGLPSLLLAAVWFVAGVGAVLAVVLAFRGLAKPAVHTLRAALLCVAAVTAAAAWASADPGMHPAGIAAWTALVAWALAGGWFLRSNGLSRVPRTQDRTKPNAGPWLWLWLILSESIALGIASAAVYMQWVFKPFS